MIDLSGLMVPADAMRDNGDDDRQPCRAVVGIYSPMGTPTSRDLLAILGIVAVPDRSLQSWHTGCALTVSVVLRITSVEKGSSIVLRLEGWLTDPYIAELRRSWMEVATGRHIVVELADVRFIAPAGKALLVEMFRSGVDIVGRDALTRAIRDEVVASILPKRRHRQESQEMNETDKLDGCQDGDDDPEALSAADFTRQRDIPTYRSGTPFGVSVRADQVLRSHNSYRTFRL